MSTTLALNATYEPMTALPIRRAVVLVLEGKAEVIEESDQDWRSANFSMKVPTVIRMTYMINKPRQSKVKLRRSSIMARDNHKCQMVINGQGCGRTATTMDHVHPRSKGGKHTWTNVVAACDRCNAKKADKTLEQMGWRLKRQPQVPTGNQWIIQSLLNNKSAPWSQYAEENLL